MCVQNLKFVAFRVPEIIGGTLKNWAVPGYAHAPFPPKFLRGFCRMDPVTVNIPAKFEVRSSFLLQNFSWACVQKDPVNVSAKFAVRSFSRS